MTMDRALLTDYICSQIKTLAEWEGVLKCVTFRDGEDCIIFPFGEHANEANWVDTYENDKGISMHAQSIVLTNGKAFLTENDELLLELVECSIVALRRIADFIHEVTMSIFDYKKGKQLCANK